MSNTYRRESDFDSGNRAKKSIIKQQERKKNKNHHNVEYTYDDYDDNYEDEYETRDVQYDRTQQTL
jgi:hypothetical protein